LRIMKTYPGGHRHLKRCDPRIKTLWRVLVNHCDRESFEVCYKRQELADLLGVSASTIDRWLNHFEQWNWIERPRRYGGRGQGNVIVMIWLQRGLELYEKRKRAEMYLEDKRQKREQNKANYQRSLQRQTALEPPTGYFKNRAVMKCRIALKGKIQNPAYLRHAVAAFGQWIKQCKPEEWRIKAILARLQAMRHLPKPKWVKAAQDVFRWIRGLITNMLVYRNWEEKFQARLEVKRATKQLQKIKRAIDQKKNCPICEKHHSKAEFEEGADASGRTNCIGSLRLKRSEFNEIWQRDIGGERFGDAFDDPVDNWVHSESWDCHRTPVLAG